MHRLVPRTVLAGLLAAATLFNARSVTAQSIEPQRAPAPGAEDAADALAPADRGALLWVEVRERREGDPAEWVFEFAADGRGALVGDPLGKGWGEWHVDLSSEVRDETLGRLRALLAPSELGEAPAAMPESPRALRVSAAFEGGRLELARDLRRTPDPATWLLRLGFHDVARSLFWRRTPDPDAPGDDATARSVRFHAGHQLREHALDDHRGLITELRLELPCGDCPEPGAVEVIRFLRDGLCVFDGTPPNLPRGEYFVDLRARHDLVERHFDVRTTPFWYLLERGSVDEFLRLGRPEPAADAPLRAPTVSVEFERETRRVLENTRDPTSVVARLRRMMLAQAQRLPWRPLSRTMPEPSSDAASSAPSDERLAELAAVVREPEDEFAVDQTHWERVGAPMFAQFVADRDALAAADEPWGTITSIRVSLSSIGPHTDGSAHSLTLRPDGHHSFEGTPPGHSVHGNYTLSDPRKIDDLTRLADPRFRAFDRLAEFVTAMGFRNFEESYRGGSMHPLIARFRVTWEGGEKHVTTYDDSGPIDLWALRALAWQVVDDAEWVRGG